MENPFELNYFSADDMKRLQSALGISRKKIGLDRINRKATIQGSGTDPYIVTLSNCTCVDFSMRRMPCKHMIRLALELGANFELPVFNADAAGRYDIFKTIKPLYDRWQEGVITTDAYIACIAALQKSAGKANRRK